MAKFAIVRADGSIDQAEGASVLDVSQRYGWPGNGDIRPWEAGDKADHEFATPDDQKAEYEKHWDPATGKKRKAGN
jgi:hypothetical protein